MNKKQLKTIHEKLNITQTCSPPRRVYGGLLHKIWYLETADLKFAVKELNKKIQFTEAVKAEYEQSEEIALQFSKRDIPAIHAIKIEKNYLIFSGTQPFLVYPWIDAKTLEKDSISETHALKIAVIVSKIHSINLSVPKLSTEAFDMHSNEKIVCLINKACTQNLIFAEQLKVNQELITKINEEYLKAIPTLQTNFVVSHGDLDQKNVLWDENNAPYLIDWETARKLNPSYEIINCALDWSGITTPLFNKHLFIKMIKTYSSSDMTINQEHLEAAFYGVLGNWLNWLVYSIERSFSPKKEQQNMGIEQVQLVLPAILRIKSYMPELIRLIRQAYRNNY